MVRDMLKSSPRGRIQRSYQGRLLSMVGSSEIFSSRKRWCCATGVKLATCLVRIALWLHPPRSILTCLLQSRVLPLLGVLLLSSRSPLSRFGLQPSLSRHLLPLVRGMRREILLGKMGLALAPTQVRPQSLAMRMGLIWSPRLDLMSLWRILLICLLGRICLLYRGLRRIWGSALKNKGQIYLQREKKL